MFLRGIATVEDNRLEGPGGTPGILSTPVTILPVPPMVEQQVRPASATITSLITNNEVRNRWGLFVEAAFPAGALKRDVELTTSGNTFSLSCQNDFFVSFSRHVVGLGINNSQPYLKNTTYVLNLGSDISWDNAWYANPDGFGNTLTVNGATIASGFRRAYDAAKVCP